MTEHLETTLGELVAAVYEAHLDWLGDEDLAEVATSTMLNELLADAARAIDEAVSDAA